MGNTSELPQLPPSNTNQIKKDNEVLGNKEETILKYQHYLQFLCKSHFTSLAYENLCAFIVQLHWRRSISNRSTSKRKGMIDIVYSSLELNQNVSSHQENTFHIVNSRKYPHRCYDLMTYKPLSKIVESFGGFEKLPLVFINGYYIGSYNEIQEMEDQKIIPALIKEEYMRRCLVCNMPRERVNIEICYYCYKQYLYWAINKAHYDIYNMRNSPFINIS